MIARRGGYLLSLALGLVLAGAPAPATAPDLSLRPQERPFTVRFTSGGSPFAPVKLDTRPRLRPGSGQAAPDIIGDVAAYLAEDPVDQPVATRATSVDPIAALALTAITESQGLGPAISLRPVLRPDDLQASVVQAGLFNRKPPRKGSVCGDRFIRGKEVGRVPGRIRGCGVQDAVRITEVSGVALSTPAVMDCTTAKALKTWVDNGLQPAFRRLGTVTHMKVAAHYACRTRNNQPGAKISEHGRGRAIDLSSFTLTNGQVVTVLNGWHRGSTGKAVKKAHASACGPFGTVLGPEADRFHRNHFHFDTARHRGGPYCR